MYLEMEVSLIIIPSQLIMPKSQKVVKEKVDKC